MIPTSTIQFLNESFNNYNTQSFIPKDPISIPHQFSHKQDIEIAGFFAAILAWGNRTSIINSCNKLMQIMNHQPHQFILHHTTSDLKKCIGFVHRTFNDTDLLYFIELLRQHYKSNESLETAFYPTSASKWEMEQMLNYFKQYFFSLENAPHRTKKHIASPATKSTCKRLNMYLRWMVRPKGPVDFGLWQRIQPKDLICPIDVHVARVARKLGLLSHPKDDWKAALELTANLREIDASDPVKFDLVLFGLGVEQEM